MDFDRIWKSAEVVDINRARERRGLPPIKSPVKPPVENLEDREEHPRPMSPFATLTHMLDVAHQAHDSDSILGEALEGLAGIDLEQVGTLFDHAKLLSAVGPAHDLLHSTPLQENDSFPNHEVLQDHVHETDEPNEDLEPREGSKHATRVPLNKIATPVSLETHMSEFGHSFTEEAIINHVFPMREAMLILESRYSNLSSAQREKLIATVIEHRENLHIDAHEFGPSSNGKDGAEFHIHSED